MVDDGARSGLGRLAQLVSTDVHVDGPGPGTTAHAPELDEALRLLAAARAGPEEGRAVDLLLRANAQRALPEALLLAVASALVDRGEEEEAALALLPARSPAALMLRADLLSRGGDLHGAAGLVEHVLFRDIDWPGARERHARWSREAAAIAGRGALEIDTPDSATRSGGGTPGLWGVDSRALRLVREVARGGAGAVYEAEDRDLGRRVALKVYHHPDRDRAQLLHEARVAVALEGEGVVRVFDVDADRGWIAMQWAPGGALGARIRAGDPEVLGAAPTWARAMAAALARVHGAGWVHHDVKPANILLASPGAALLTDFGTARRRNEPSPPGSPGYVSPERMAGRASDPRDDIFGFGRVLMAAGVAGAWRELAEACAGPDAGRPASGRDLVAALPEGRV
jgi:serine/threonine-protein kinase